MKTQWRNADPALGRVMFEHAVGFLGWKNRCIKAGVPIGRALDRAVEVQASTSRRYARLIVRVGHIFRFVLADDFQTFEKTTAGRRALYRLPTPGDVMRAEFRRKAS